MSTWSHKQQDQVKPRQCSWDICLPTILQMVSVFNQASMQKGWACIHIINALTAKDLVLEFLEAVKEWADWTLCLKSAMKQWSWLASSTFGRKKEKPKHLATEAHHTSKPAYFNKFFLAWLEIFHSSLLFLYNTTTNYIGSYAGHVSKDDIQQASRHTKKKEP